uniref:Uncharacterized protein n=1 Tax=Equus asinus TaxID=9793 RepID=A0A9L0JVE0_EQUAS
MAAAARREPAQLHWTPFSVLW